MIPTKKFGKEVFQVPDEFNNLLYDAELDPVIVYEEVLEDDTPDQEANDDSLVEYVIEEEEECEENENIVLIPFTLPVEYPPISVTILSNITADKRVQENEVSQLLLQYVNSVREQKFSFNRLTLSNEAMAIAEFLGYKNFVVSSEWMSRFTSTNRINFASPVQDIFDEKAFFLLRLGAEDFYYHRGGFGLLIDSSN